MSCVVIFSESTVDGGRSALPIVPRAKRCASPRSQKSDTKPTVVSLHCTRLLRTAKRASWRSARHDPLRGGLVVGEVKFGEYPLLCCFAFSFVTSLPPWPGGCPIEEWRVGLSVDAWTGCCWKAGLRLLRTSLKGSIMDVVFLWSVFRDMRLVDIVNNPVQTTSAFVLSLPLSVFILAMEVMYDAYLGTSENVDTISVWLLYMTAIRPALGSRGGNLRFNRKGSRNAERNSDNNIGSEYHAIHFNAIPAHSDVGYRFAEEKAVARTFGTQTPTLPGPSGL